MLVLFNPMNTLINGVIVRLETPQYKLIDRDLLRRLMQRTGTGKRINTRDLAKAVGLSHGTISNLLTGIRTDIPCENAHALANTIGVDVLVLFVPTGRCVPATDEPIEDEPEQPQPLTVVPEQVSA